MKEKGSAVASRTRARKSNKAKVPKLEIKKVGQNEAKETPFQLQKKRRQSSEFSVLSTLQLLLDETYEMNSTNLDHVYGDDGMSKYHTLLAELFAPQFDEDLNRIIFQSDKFSTKGDRERTENLFQFNAIYFYISDSQGDGKKLEEVFVGTGNGEQISIPEDESNSQDLGNLESKLSMSGEYILCELRMQICLGYILKSRDIEKERKMKPSPAMLKRFKQAILSVFPKDEELSDEVLFSTSGRKTNPLRLLRQYKENLYDVFEDQDKVNMEEVLRLAKLHDWETFVSFTKRYLQQLHVYTFGIPELLKKKILAGEDVKAKIPKELRQFLLQKGVAPKELNQIETDISQNFDNISKIQSEVPKPKKRRVSNPVQTEEYEPPIEEGQSETVSHENGRKLKVSPRFSPPSKGKQNMKHKTSDENHVRDENDIHMTETAETIFRPYPVTSSPKAKLDMSKVKRSEVSDTIDELKNASAALAQLGGADPLAAVIKKNPEGKQENDNSEDNRSCQDNCKYDSESETEATPQPPLKKPAEPQGQENTPRNIVPMSKDDIIDKAVKSKRQKRVAWSAEEVNALEDGVRHFGVGNWSKIFTHFGDSFHACRNPVSLKDKWRNLQK